MKKSNTPYAVHSVSQLHLILGLPKPAHPLISVIHFETIKYLPAALPDSVTLHFYSIWLKNNYNGKMKYGQNEYDFDGGVMSFFSPGQVITTVFQEEFTHTGYWLIIHPDFLWNYPLAKTIKGYGYFSYAVHEALHVSEKEEAMMTDILVGIEDEYRSAIDNFSQNVIISRIELLLNYANRFYNRQFITRKILNHNMLERLEKILNAYFNGDSIQKQGLPTVQYLSAQLNVSANYLSDLLRKHTGQSTQQHIHDKLIEKAKEKLSTTSLSVNEIAYQLGFEHSQSFSKLFKGKTNVSPLQFRQSFN